MLRKLRLREKKWFSYKKTYIPPRTRGRHLYMTKIFYFNMDSRNEEAIVTAITLHLGFYLDFNRV